MSPYRKRLEQEFKYAQISRRINKALEGKLFSSEQQIVEKVRRETNGFL